jgi:hypothetical protein
MPRVGHNADQQTKEQSMKCEQAVDLVSLREMLRARVPGTKIRELLGISVQDQVIYARAWRITRKRGRPRKVKC